jgi:hypothetical protein
MAVYAMAFGLRPLPGARRCGDRVQRLCERWADDAAVTRTDKGALIRALQRMRSLTDAGPRAEIDSRLSALEVPVLRSRPTVRRLVYAMGAGVVSLAMVFGAAAAADAHVLVDAAGFCGL